MKILALIPARGGSKGVPRKNIKLLNGKPLIEYTVNAAKEVFDDDDIILSTEDEEIKQVVENLGLTVPFLRPAHLATDQAGTYEVLLHAIEFVEERGAVYDVLVLLQPTSPLRTVKHIREALNLYTPDVDMIVSVKESSANPYYNLFEENQSGLLEKSKNGNYTRRQDCPKVWEYNGAIYVINIKELKKSPIHQLKKIKKYEMDDLSSLDIDCQLDFELVEYILAKRS